jgi:hypothetical protein
MYSASSLRNRGVGTHTALTRASSRGDVRLIQHLLTNGANVNGSIHRSKSTALHYAASTGHVASCKILVQYGANVNSFDAEMNTPLHLAAQNGNAHVVEFLLRQGADRSVETSYGLTALQMAESNCHKDCVRLLKPCPPEPLFPPISSYRDNGERRDESLNDSDASRFQAHLRKVHACQKVTRWLEDLAQHGMLEPQTPRQSRWAPQSGRGRGNADARRETSFLSMSTTTLDGSMLSSSKRPGNEKIPYNRPFTSRRHASRLRLTQSAPVQCT